MLKKFLSAFLLFISCSTFADGALYVETSSVWDLHAENKQVAAISYNNGFENLSLAIKVQQAASMQKMLWIVPVPAAPEKIAIDIAKEFPEFVGLDISRKYNQSKGIPVLMLYYFSPLYFIFEKEARGDLFSWLYNNVKSASGGIGQQGLISTSEVVLHESISSDGVTTELLTTKNAGALQQYLQNKNLVLPAKDQEIFNQYIGQNYSFVITYISDAAKLAQTAIANDLVLAIKAQFPVPQIYFPLRLTSVYNSVVTPIVLYVEGHVSPRLYPAIKANSSVNYNVGDRTKFTKIAINAPSKYFTDDLWIDNSAPAKIIWQNLFIKYHWFFVVFIYAIFSMFASLVAGKLIFRSRIKISKLIGLGLWNLLTLAGFFIAIIFTQTRFTSVSQSSRVFKNWLHSIADIKKIPYLLIFYCIFIGLMVITFFNIL